MPGMISAIIAGGPWSPIHQTSSFSSPGCDHTVGKGLWTNRSKPGPVASRLRYVSARYLSVISWNRAVRIASLGAHVSWLTAALNES